ncbi:MAG: hypothetical protein KDK70_15865 [Myxococcales bacterium]|nr:hypothetical protein [Myxococcales bacterium]
MVGLTPWIARMALALALGAEPSPAAPAPPSPVGDEGEPPPSEGEPPPPAPSDAAVRAQQHFQAGEWDAAIEALMEAYALDPDPAYLYARAQAERMRGNCRVAIALYERFLEGETTDRQREDTQRHIRLCEEVLFNEQAHAARPPTPLVPLESAPPSDDPAPLHPQDPQRPAKTHPWYRDPAGMTLLVTGSVATVGGGLLWSLGDEQLEVAPRASTEGVYETQVERGRRNIALGASLVGIGGSLLLGAAIRLGVVAKRHRQATAAARLQPKAGAGGLTLRF